MWSIQFRVDTISRRYVINSFWLNAEKEFSSNQISSSIRISSGWMQRDCVSLFYIPSFCYSRIPSRTWVVSAVLYLRRVISSPFFSFFSPSIIMWMSLWGPPFFSLLLLLLFPSGKKKPPAHICIQSIITYRNCFVSFFLKKKNRKKKFLWYLFIAFDIFVCVCVYCGV